MNTMTAQEARQQAQDYKDQICKAQFDEIMAGIKESVSKGLFNYTLFANITPENEKALKASGFRVRHSFDRNDEQTEITW